MRPIFTATCENELFTDFGGGSRRSWVDCRRATLYIAPGSRDALDCKRRETDKTQTDLKERHKALSMSGFKEPGFSDRQKAAQQAKQNLLNKFRSQPGPDDPRGAR